MIISASRRTDIPAFYARWFIQRIRAGSCTVPNPFNADQVTHVSLAPEQVDAIVFWTRNPRPLFPYLADLDARGYRYYFQYTLTGYPRTIDPFSPPPTAAIQTFRALAERIGPQRVIWRYDPILIGQATDPEYHRLAFERLAEALSGCTRRVVVSWLDVYAKARKRLAAMESACAGLTWTKDDLQASQNPLPAPLGDLMNSLTTCAGKHGMEIQSCAEASDLRPFGIQPGKCIDANLLQRVFGLDIPYAKDPNQRPACGCIAAKDIGMYDSCLFGCVYCYATSSFERARRNYDSHNPAGASLLARR